MSRSRGLNKAIYLCLVIVLVNVGACVGDASRIPVPVATPGPERAETPKVFPVEPPGEFVGKALEGRALPQDTTGPGGEDQRVLIGQSENGKRLYVDDFIGKVLVVNYWTAGCVPCRRLLDQLRIVQRAYAHRNVEIIAVNLGDSPAVIAGFLRGQSTTFGLTAASDRSGDASRALGVTTLPTTVLFDIDGTVFRRYTGTAGVDARRLEDDIDLMLNGRV